MLYGDTSEFLDSVVPFISDGLKLTQPIMVAVIGSRIQAIRAALGDAADQVSFVDMSQLGHNPARIIPALRRYLDTHGGDRAAVRVVGEPIWLGRRATEITECQLHEGLLNLAIAPDTPLWLLCPYDVHALEQPIAAEAHRSHPAVVEHGHYKGSTEYTGAYYVQCLFAHDLPEPPACAELRTFSAADLGGVTNRVTGAAFRAGISVERASQLACAVREIACDATATSHGQGTLRLWIDADAMICEVRDRLRIDDPIIGRIEATTSAGRKGLWRANQICDLIQVRSNAAGTTVRVHTWV